MPCIVTWCVFPTGSYCKEIQYSWTSTESISTLPAVLLPSPCTFHPQGYLQSSGRSSADIIEHIDPQYYQKKTLSFVVKELSPLWKEYAKLVEVWFLFCLGHTPHTYSGDPKNIITIPIHFPTEIHDALLWKEYARAVALWFFLLLFTHYNISRSNCNSWYMYIYPDSVTGCWMGVQNADTRSSP